MLKVREISRSVVLIFVGLGLANCSDTSDSSGSDVRTVPTGIVAQDAQWESVADGLVYTDGIAAESDGDTYFAEVTFNRLYKVDAAHEVSVIEESAQMTMGLAIGPDGLLYACRNHAAQIVRYGAQGAIEVLLQGELYPIPDDKVSPGEFCNDLAINSEGGIWFTDRVNQRVRYLAPDGSVRDVASGFRPNGITLSLDRQMLVVTDSYEPVLHAYSTGANGELTELPDFFDPVLLPKPLPDGRRIGKGHPGSNGMTVDTEGRFYVATFSGIQIFDRNGRRLGVLDYPAGLYYLSGVGFGGTDYQWLYATGRNGIFRIRTIARGIGW